MFTIDSMTEDRRFCKRVDAADMRGSVPPPSAHHGDNRNRGRDYLL